MCKFKYYAIFYISKPPVLLQQVISRAHLNQVRLNLVINLQYLHVLAQIKPITTITNKYSNTKSKHIFYNGKLCEEEYLHQFFVLLSTKYESNL